MARLTARERDMLLLSAAGLRTAEIAAALGIAENTVKVERRLMRAKLHARNAAQAVALALLHGDITLEDVQAIHRSDATDEASAPREVDE